MNEVLAVSLQSMQADMARLDQVGMNLANALTPGYKRGVAVQSPVASEFAAFLSKAGAATTQAGALAPALVFTPDTRPGTLKSTGQSLDVALTGKGYFEVVTDNGPAYTRQGSFRLDARGRLVTAQGYAVMGVAGEVSLNLANPVISPNGAISLSAGPPDAMPLAQLKVVEFDPNAKLERLGDGLFAAGAGMKLVGEQEVSVRQGFLENSNVSSTYEMTSLVQTMRHFESMQKMAQGYDDMLATAIRKLGETS
jgi:flagellar basal-body rod protein FlgF